MLNSPRVHFLGAAALTLLLAVPATAQGGGGRGGFGRGFGQRQGPTPADPAAARDAELVREIHLVRVLSHGKISRETLQQLRDLVASGQAQRKQHETETAARLRQGEPLLAEAKKAILAGQSVDAATEQERTFSTGYAQLNGQLQNADRDLVAAIRKLLEAAPEDRTAAVAAGSALVREQRAQQAAARGGFGGRGGAGRSTRELDQLRSANPQDYPNQRVQFALRNANIQGWWMLQGGAAGGAAGGPAGAVAGAPGGAPAGPGGGPAGPGGGRQVQPPDVNSAAVQAQLKPFLQMADQVRNMPPAIYQQSRDRLSQQLDTARQLARVNAPVADDQALDALARALSGTEALPALDAKLGKVTPAGS